MKCYNCGEKLDIGSKYCNNCGKRLPEKIDGEHIMEMYEEVSKTGYNDFSENVKKYLNENYEIPAYFTALGKPHLNKFLGGCFILGHNVRKTELRFLNLISLDEASWEHNEKTLELLKSGTDEYKAICDIATYKENNNDTILLGKEVEHYSLLGLDWVNAFLPFMVMDFLKTVDTASLGIPKNTDSITEIACRNACLGYCFVLAEEIVNNYKPN